MSYLFRPRIAITMGDPCGVGPEIIVKLLAAKACAADYRPVVVGDLGALGRAASLLGAALRFEESQSVTEWERLEREDVVPVTAPMALSPEDLVHGAPTEASCLCAIRCIEAAVSMALEGKVDAICTCPIHKANLHRHGFAFPGHTEFLRDLTGAGRVVMMLAGPRLRVSLATIHVALSQVPGLITPECLTETIRITGESLVRDFGLAAPRIAVAALNPHAGEDGRFGSEERDIIEPTLEGLRGIGGSIHGPFSADTLFWRAFQGEFDAVVAMYHDQGLIPIKLAHFHEAVNVTLGLPIIRASVDHGTAYEIAGTGKAHFGSLEAAVDLAARMARHRLG
ncbi:MAG: 4-hydroxythreonine-4-phosphate dehydrogenase PdxA [Syntrophobacteraceae bacterium]|nr:4-hydroxythreonine-4-phosphate dehydrogenase PdxA [Syntrophobacteraceae bacterium]